MKLFLLSYKKPPLKNRNCPLYVTFIIEIATTAAPGDHNPRADDNTMAVVVWD